MMAAQELQRIRRGAADGAGWSEKAALTLASAQQLADADPQSALTLAYDAARLACMGVLARQALRPTTKGGHYAIQRAMRYQFGSAFEGFGALRRRRNELEYPEFPDEIVDRQEVDQALARARSIIAAADKLAVHLDIF
jgi:HEPN domain